MSDVTTDEPGDREPGGLAEEQAPSAPLPLASFDDPHLQPLAKQPGRAEGVVGILLVVGLLGFAAYGAVYWVGGQPQVEGISLGVGLFSFGFGLSAWGKYLLPQGPFMEKRHKLASSDDERAAMAAAIVERGGMMVKRRSFLGGILGIGGAVMGVVLAFPLLRSLGPVPAKTFDVTNWHKGSRLVDNLGRPVHVADLEVGGSLTVFPEGYTSEEAMAVDQTILIRIAGPDVEVVTEPSRATWGPDGYLAFSKVCTHAGCPVGLFQHQTLQLLCPCHQSLFNVGQGRPATNVFGPAPRPLPQLPLYVDDAGFLRSQAGYDQPIGPGFWERTTT
ncbi:MAG: Rieske 2Fe-2S domain-containing protein [Actinomycetota bacterium]|jgi:ubiquinol-cytochrome c reductase iron-sulfur subunit|nr:Rieske 2Fe-2S domain-containing protein [Actinomycetota bacterium]MDA8280505.1 Rieske 2Fe-2S domain-containing protein [Actinomycetota bacterium]